MRARHACLSRRAPRFILAGALGSPRARAAFLTVSDKPTRDASRARGRASGPRRSPCSRTLLPKHARVCVQERRTRGVGTIACQDVLEGAKPRGRLGEHPLLRDDGLGRVPAAGPPARGGRCCPGQLGGSSMSSSRGGVCPPRRLIQAPSRCLRVGGRSAVPFAVPPELGVPQAGAASPRGVCPSPRHLRSGARPRHPVRSSTCSREGDEAGAASEEDAALP